MEKEVEMIVIKLSGVKSKELHALTKFVNGADGSPANSGDMRKIRRAGRNWLVYEEECLDSPFDVGDVMLVEMKATSYDNNSYGFRRVYYEVEIRVRETFGLWTDNYEGNGEGAIVGYETPRSFIVKIFNLLGRVPNV